MAKHITVWMNGKKTKIRRGEADVPNEKIISEDEHAAAMDEQPHYTEDTLSLPAKDSNNDEHYSVTPKKKNQKWKPVVIAILSAICMGSIFGMIMLKVVGSLDDNGNTASSANMAMNDKEENDGNDNEVASEDESSFTLPELEAFVLQGGVYEEEDSVDDWKASFQEAAFSPIVWEQDDKYYLLVEMRYSDEEAAELATEIEETYEFEVFVKEWQTDQKELNLDKEEQEWMDSVIELWENSLETIDDDADFPEGDWEDLVKESPDENEELEEFTEELTERTDNLDKPSTEKASGFLLQIWYSMEADIE